jgi:hypothetical protein
MILRPGFLGFSAPSVEFITIPTIPFLRHDSGNSTPRDDERDAEDAETTTTDKTDRSMNSILRTAAMVLGLAGITMTASAQTVSPDNLVAMTMVQNSAASTEVSEMSHAMAVAARIEGEDADAVVRGAVERLLVEGAPELKVVRTVMTGDGWIVKMSELGLPKSEYRKGVVVYHVPGMEPVVRQIAVERPYFGSADDAAKYSVRLGAVRL